MAHGTPVLTPERLLSFYARGQFPMQHADGLYLHDPDPRAIFPIDDLKPNARLRRYTRNNGYGCTMDTAFEQVMRACADPGPRSGADTETWISEEMIQAYTALHTMGHALSVEVWQQDELIGGLYGVKIGRAFFGESMFSRKPNASKAAFHHVASHLRANGYTLLDTQYINDHTRSLGAVEVTREEFRKMLRAALDLA